MIRQRLRKIILAPIFFVGALFAFMIFVVSTVQAQTSPSGAFIVRPAKAEVTILPGETKTTTFTLENNTQVPLHVDVSFEDVDAAVQTSPVDEPVTLDGASMSERSLRGSLSVAKTSFNLLAGHTVDVPVTLALPKTALPGGRYGAVVWTFQSAVPPSVNDTANISVQSRIASVFYVRVQGETKEEGKLVAFGLFNNAKTVSEPTESSPIKFQVAYENTGTVHVNPYGRITVSGIFGKSTVLPIDPWAVLPGATRLREIDLFDAFWPGYYTAHLELNRGYKDIVDEVIVHFFILPSTKEIFIALGLLLFVFIVLRKSLRLSRNNT